MNIWRRGCAALSACVLHMLLISAASAAASTVRSSLDLRVPVAPALVTVAGQAQLIHELHVTNYTDKPVTILAAQVLNERGASMLDLRGAELEQRLGGPGVADVDAVLRRTLPAGMHAVLYLELSLDAGSSPLTLQHRLQYAVDGDDASKFGVVEDAPMRLDRTPAPVLSAPLRGGPWVAIHDPTWTRGHRRMLFAIDGRARIPGRFAMDFVRLDDEGNSSRGDVDVVTNWLGYAEEVLAVADAVVVAARDDMTEVERVSAHPRHALGDATGNFIALDIGAGRFAFYEHLKPGSVRVRVGQRVHSGEVIAALGFTGDSTGPHLHFHVADGNAPLAAEGRPYAFAEFELLGQFTTLDRLGSSAWQTRAEAIAAQRRAERPGANVVLKFPESGD
jgi:murein DD-endopeptidase